MKYHLKSVLIIWLLLLWLVIFSIFNRTSDKIVGNWNGIDVKKIVLADIWRAWAAPFYVAKEKWLFWPSINVEIKRLPNMWDHRLWIHAGTIDIYQWTHDMLLSTDWAEIPWTIFMAWDESRWADWLLVTADIKSIKDLKWKKVALEVWTPAYLLFQYLAVADWLTLEDFDVQNIPIPDWVTAFIGWRVDAAWAWEPYISNALKEVDWARMLATSESFPWLFPWLYAARDWLFDNEEYLLDFLLWRTNALDYIEENPEESFKIMWQAYGMSSQDMKDLKKDIIWYDGDEMKKFFNRESPINIFEKFEEVKKIMWDNWDTPSVSTSDEVISTKIIENL